MLHLIDDVEAMFSTLFPSMRMRGLNGPAWGPAAGHIYLGFYLDLCSRLDRFKFLN